VLQKKRTGRLIRNWLKDSLSLARPMAALDAYHAMEKARRAHADMNIPAGAAVFFYIQGFVPGHIAISSGQIDGNGSPMFVSTGGRSGVRGFGLSHLMK